MRFEAHGSTKQTSKEPPRAFLPAIVSALLAVIPPATTTDASEARDTAVIELPAQISIAGKTPRAQDDSPLPGTVITAREMRATGAATLADVLAEQTGLTMVHDHGTGVQMQGLSPDYTLILVDGEPAVGRTAGTLELNRFRVGGLDQVEIVKGPSSSLYGSEALGGMINLVTRKPVSPFAADVYVRAGAREELNLNTLSTGGNLETTRDALGISLFADRTASEGYDLDPDTRSRTAPRYEAYTLQPGAEYALADSSRLRASSRLFLESQRDPGVFVLTGDSVPARSRAHRFDGAISTGLDHRISDRLSLEAKLHGSRYRTESSLRIDSAGMARHDSLVSRSVFDQEHYKGESFVKTRLPGYGSHTLIAGGGGAWERVEADRIESGERAAASGFLFAQEDWSPAPRLLFQFSGRLDAHSDYAANFSPRAAGLYRPMEWLALRASAGKGFKAPNFQELYLDFTNASVGYTVFGSAGAKEGVETLEEQGQIAEILLPLENHVLRPEKSWSFNAGVEASLDETRLPFGHGFNAKANLFRNNVSDLIDSRPVARRTNGRHVYTYFNLDRIHTQGIETDVSFAPRRGVTFGGGYQYLIARDDDVLDQIRRGDISKVGATGVVRPVQMTEYGGLFGRSRHSGNVKAAWEQGLRENVSAAIALRALFRGRYGYADRNGNGILDSDDEYEAGYSLWNLSASVTLNRWLTLETRVDNLFDTVRPRVPLPGRLIYAGMRLQSF